jgi:carboxyl-terminal processing protease
MTFKTRLSVLLLSTPVLAFVVVGGLLGHTSARADNDSPYANLRVFSEVFSLVKQNYVEEVKVDRVMEGAMRGLAEGLDPDSAYLNAKQTRDVESGAALPDGDVGLELTRQFYLRVIAARDGSPAAKAGLQTGDFIRGIDGKATRDMSVFEGTRLLRGQPGSKVSLTIIRNSQTDPHIVDLVREKATGPVVTGKLIGTTVGYVRVAAFRNGVADDLTKQARDLTKAGATALVIDVRHTAEGPLDNGIAAARVFVKSGTLTSRGKKKDAAEKIAASAGDGAIDLPVQLLVSTGTSGAAEIFAAALRDNHRADLVGEHTLGRAALQKLVKLPENRGLWLTYAKFFTPAGEPIQGKGLDPTVTIDDPDIAEFGGPAPEKDPILDAAIARAKSKKAA